MNYFFKSSLRNKYVITFILIEMLIMTVTGLYFYSSISSILTGNEYNSIQQLIQQVNNNIEYQLSDIDNTAILFMSDPSLAKNLAANVDESEKFMIRSTIEYKLNPLLFSSAWNSRLLNSIFLFKDEQTFFYALRSYFSEKQINSKTLIYKSTLNKDRNMRLLSPAVNDKAIYYLRNIFDLDFPADPVGVLIMEIDEEVLSRQFQSILQYPGSKTYIFDEKGVIFSHSDKNMLGTQADKSFVDLKDSFVLKKVNIEDEVYLVTAKKIGEYNLTSIVAIPEREVLKSLSSSMKIYWQIILLIMAISLLFGFFLSSKITNPIQDLLHKITQVKDGNFDTKMPSYKDAELNKLSSTFNKMTDEIHYLINQVYEKQLLLKEAELQSLKSQVNPHFIFNVLGTISWEAKTSGNDKIYKIATSLGQHLRYHISRDSREKITIREELENIQFYLYLQEMRFGDKLKIQINVDEDESILDCLIPKLCIQPIVENAIIHGLENKRGVGNLTVNITRKSEVIIFEICDDGVGFNAEIDLSGKDSITSRRDGHSSIGLYNTNKRIKLMYGEQYGIQITSRLDVGTVVTVYIPVDKGEC